MFTNDNRKRFVYNPQSYKQKIELKICRALPRREPFQKFSKAQDKLRPRRGFGNSFQPAIDAPRLVPH
uniref:Uncharacterized protein n=1 Tax=Brassica oleracea TaxID=3712 RepID=A0A3P6A7N5_BRAOL|nr:unnamed protein product [Brassica oleracea]